MLKRNIILFLILAGVSLNLWAYDPPLGAEISGQLSSPELLAGGYSVAAQDSPMAFVVNPAATALLQRVTFDVNYSALVGLGLEKGLGHAVNFGIAIPQPYGIWNVFTGLVLTPFRSAFPVGNVFTAKLGFAKDVYPDLFVGATINTQLGFNGDFGWGLSADIGVMGLAGDLGFLKDFTWGVSMRNMGKSFNTKQSVGFLGTQASSYSSPFTLQAGVSSNLIRSEKTNIKLGLSFDFWFPAFQNMVFSTGLKFSWADIVFVRMGWDINLREAVAKVNQGFIPSFFIGASIPLGKDEDASKQKYSEIKPGIAVAQLTGDVWAFSMGVNVPIGKVDKTPPQILIDYPATKYEAYYISPNNDGIKDMVVLPIKITDERYVQSYELQVLDSKGTVVRTIANKEARPETQDFVGFFKRLGYVKKGVPVPNELVWNGYSDNGELVPDGAYSIVVNAVDDNGNKSSTEPWAVIVDTVAPTITITTKQDSALIFSPDGDGNKDTLIIEQTGSLEDEWKAEIYNSSNQLTMSWLMPEAKNIEWAGKNSSGQIVNDGVYLYSIEATDRAGNTGYAMLKNIVVNTEQPPVNLSIDKAAFSPNGDGIQDNLIVKPDVPIKKGLTNWELVVIDASKNKVWQKSGASDLPASYTYNGTDTLGKVLGDGLYSFKLLLIYENGYKPEVNSPIFVIDTKAPQAKITINQLAFNPLGDNNSTISINQSGSEEELWTGAIISKAGNAVKTWLFNGKPDSTFSWDGTDNAGKTVPDGQYMYNLTATDKAGNKANILSPAIIVDTQNKTVRLDLDSRAFSPNADGVLDTITFFPESKSSTKIQDWVLTITSVNGVLAKKFSGQLELPSKLVWDGKTENNKLADNNLYYAELEVRYITKEVEKAKTVGFALDTLAPSIELQPSYTVFSPNGDGRKDSLIIKQSSVAGDNWEGFILDAKGNVVKNWAWQDKVLDLAWNGQDNAGNKVPDGNYSYVIKSEDSAGNKTKRSVENIVVDTRSTQVFATTSGPGLSPNGDNVADTIAIGLVLKVLDGIEDWKLSILNSSGNEIKTFDGTGSKIMQSIIWDGKDNKGKIIDGTYTAAFTVNYIKGDKAEASTSSFVLATQAPDFTVSLTPQYFSPDNDGVDDELVISLTQGLSKGAAPIASWSFEITEESVVEGSGKKSERAFFTWTGQGKPSDKLIWDGRSQKNELVEAATDYPYKFVVKDILGNVTTKTGFVSVDVLVIRDGDKLKIKVPSIVFRPNFADFKDLPEDIINRNAKVLKRIAEILNKFKDYQIRVEGHANSIAKINSASKSEVEREEIQELLPLSASRAEAVMNKLVEYGVARQRLSVKGLGSSESVVPFTDTLNRWKNRRVEFILVR